MEEKFVCVHCEKEFTDDYKNIIDGEFVCDYCLAELYAKCDDCGDYILKNDLLETKSRNFICKSCYEKNYFTCSCCNNIYPTENSHSADDELFCENCFYDNYSYCHSCNTPVHRDNVYYHESSGNDYCSECYPGDSDDDERQNNYSEKRYSPQEKLTYEELPYSRTFGIELETSCNPNECFSGYFKQVHDGSISGMEYVSPILQGDEGLQVIRDFCSDAVNSGLDTNKATGFHLHQNSKDISFRKLKNILLIYKYLEPVIYDMVAPSRKTSNWCKPIEFSVSQILNCKKEKDIQILYYSFNPDVKKQYIKNYCKQKFQQARYSGCNLHSHWFRGTIELRYHGGTLNSTKVINWIKLHQIIFAYAIGHKTKTIVKLFDYSNKLEILNQIINQSLLKQDDKTQLVSYVAERISHFTPRPAPIPAIIPVPEETVIPAEVQEEVREPALVFFNA